jgi:outer membrane protein assembly factor BamE (lipoprotein component of BamABCDE complex)
MCPVYGPSLVACIMSAIVSTACGPPSAFKAEYEHFNKVQVGWTEEKVREHLGEPFKVYDRATAPAHYYLDGHGYKERPITNKVWIYQGVEPVAYVYFNENGVVEEVVVRGS